MSFINTYQTYVIQYTIENKILKMQISKKKKNRTQYDTKSACN